MAITSIAIHKAQLHQKTESAKKEIDEAKKIAVIAVEQAADVAIAKVFHSTVVRSIPILELNERSYQISTFIIRLLVI